jgi:hypothetical protein
MQNQLHDDLSHRLYRQSMQELIGIANELCEDLKQKKRKNSPRTGAIMANSFRNIMESRGCDYQRDGRCSQ